MKCNIVKTERWIRVLLGLFLLSLVFWGPETAWGYLGLIPLISGVVGFCPAYKLFNFNLFPLD